MAGNNANVARNEHGKVLYVKKVDLDGISVEDISAYLDEIGVEYNDVDVANWPEYNKQTPTAQFRAVHTGDSIVINYRATESSVAAIADDGDLNLWEDACMEIFSAPVDDGTYYNLESNCAGSVLLESGVVGNRYRAGADILSKVKRWASLGRELFAERIGECTWQLVIVFPVSAYYKHNIADVTGMAIRANIYKCGNKLQQPHLLSWNPVDAPRPQFHAPDSFGTFVFMD